MHCRFTWQARLSAEQARMAAERARVAAAQQVNKLENDFNHTETGKIEFL